MSGRSNIASGGCWTADDCGIVQRSLRPCGRDRALIPPDRLAILLAPKRVRASTSAADEAKNGNQET
jgi:hypothetical protein